MGNLNKNKNIKEVVAICDQLDGAVTKCDLKNINIESLIHIVRGQKVMLDSDLVRSAKQRMCAVTKMEVSPELILGLIK